MVTCPGCGKELPDDSRFCSCCVAGRWDAAAGWRMRSRAWGRPG